MASSARRADRTKNNKQKAHWTNFFVKLVPVIHSHKTRLVPQDFWGTHLSNTFFLSIVIGALSFLHLSNKSRNYWISQKTGGSLCVSVPKYRILQPKYNTTYLFFPMPRSLQLRVLLVHVLLHFVQQYSLWAWKDIALSGQEKKSLGSEVMREVPKINLPMKFLFLRIAWFTSLSVRNSTVAIPVRKNGICAKISSMTTKIGLMKIGEKRLCLHTYWMHSFLSHSLEFWWLLLPVDGKSPVYVSAIELFPK